jgi:hypothetical protein
MRRFESMRAGPVLALIHCPVSTTTQDSNDRQEGFCHGQVELAAGAPGHLKPTVAGTLPPLSNFFNGPARRRGFFGGGQASRCWIGLDPALTETADFGHPASAFPRPSVKPLVLVEAELRGKTGEGRLRHPSFKGVREDIE